MFIEFFSSKKNKEPSVEEVTRPASPPAPSIKIAPESIHGDRITFDSDLVPPSPRKKIANRPLSVASAPAFYDATKINKEDLKFYQGGVRRKYKPYLKWIGRIGFVAKGVVYGCIGVLTITNVTGAWTPNGSNQNESPQGAFLLLGGIPTIGRTVLIIMAVGLILYIIWRFWEAITGQGSDASFSKKKNFFRYRLSPFISGCVYTAYTYYVVLMIFETSEEQQARASSTTFPASWTKTTIGKVGIGFLGLAFLIAFTTQLINALTANFIQDLKTGEPTARKWEAFIVHWFGRIGFFGRAALFGTVSGFFWDSLAKQNESGDKNMIAAAINKLATSTGGKFFMVVLGLSLVIYAVFAVGNAHYKYFPTPPPTRFEYYTHHLIHPEYSSSRASSSSCSVNGDNEDQLTVITTEEEQQPDLTQPTATTTTDLTQNDPPKQNRWTLALKKLLGKNQENDLEKQ